MSVRPIILAEDNDTLRRLYSDVLGAHGFTVMGVSDGEKALNLLHKVVNPLLIILDVMMPRLDGIETCTRVRRMQGLHPCPILFLTALDNPDTVLECLRAGGDDYLVKSAPMKEVVQRVQYWSRRGPSEASAERRAKAIKELETIALEDRAAGALADEIPSEQAAINQIAEFITRSDDGFGDGDPMLYRFGYVVGLVNACIQQDASNESRFNRFLRNLVFKTGFVDRKEIDALLDNYERIVSQKQFRQGWLRGRNDAPNVGLPQLGRIAARFEDQPG